MQTIGIDFLQYTIQVYGGLFQNCTEWSHHIDILRDVILNTMSDFAGMFLNANWQEGDNHIAPYSHSMAVFLPNGVRLANVYWSDKSINTVLVQHTGQGCQKIPNILAYVYHVQSRLNRIDVCLDVLTEEKPEVYFAEYKGKLAVGWENTPTGQTLYLGSRHSEKMWRIYRYLPPHERAHLLRFEGQYRGEYARSIAWHISQSNVQDVLYTELRKLKLAPLEKYLSVSVAGSVHVGKKKHGNTLAWLERSVKPAIQKLVREGEIDAYAWINKLMDEIDAF